MLAQGAIWELILIAPFKELKQVTAVAYIFFPLILIAPFKELKHGKTPLENF